MNDAVNHPPHYKGNGLEVIEVIEAFGLDQDFCLGNVVKYVLRAGRKGDATEDLQKARWYLDRRIRDGRGAAESAPLYYLATPYSKYKHGIERAFTGAAALAAALLKVGITAYSPIAHTHPLAIHGGLDPLDHGIWLSFDEAMMRACDALLVAHMAGWDESKGVAHEIDWFTRAGKPMFHLYPHGMQIRPWVTDDASGPRSALVNQTSSSSTPALRLREGE